MHRHIYRSLITSALILLIAHSTSQARETIIMDNGDRISGKLVHMIDGVLEMETGYAGTVRAEWKHVQEISSDNTFDVRILDNNVLSVHSMKLLDNAVMMDGKVERLANVMQLNPADWELGKAAKINGEIDVSLKLERGNTHDELTDFQSRLEWRKKSHRVRLGTEFEYNQSGPDVTADRWALETAYDNTASKHFYFGERTTFKSDRMSDLVLRWSTGPYAGVHLIDTHRTKLNAETGFEYASDRYRFKQIETFLGESWRVGFSHFIIPDKLEIYHRESGMFSLTSSVGCIFDTWTGLKFPIANGMYTSAEVKTTYNGDAPSEAIPWDTSYRFKIGYQW